MRRIMAASSDVVSSLSKEDSRNSVLVYISESFKVLKVKEVELRI